MAEYRKLIKFGTNSIIISLPKPWIERNKLQAGDSIQLKPLYNYLLITPHDVEKTAPNTNVIINTEGYQLQTIKRKIINTYINNTDIIILKGKNLPSYRRELREFMHRFVALEIIEESPKRIQAKCYLNMQDIHIDNLIRKTDAIIKSMFTDTLQLEKEEPTVPPEKLHDDIAFRDHDVNKLCYLMMRTIRYYLENPQAQASETKHLALLNKWMAANLLEKIGDHIKRLNRILIELDKNELKKILALLKNVRQHYDEVMKSYYRKDVEKGHQLSLKKQEMAELFDEYQESDHITIPATRALYTIRQLFFRVDELTTLFD